MSWDQWLVLIAGVGGVWLAVDPEHSVRRWGPVLALVGQPGWVVAAWDAQQLGYLIASVLFTFVWLRGIWTYWVAPRLRRGRKCDEWIEYDITRRQ